MQRPILWPWILLALLLLLAPGPAGRFLLDLLGGLTLLLLLLPLLFGVAGFVGWQLLRRRLRTCAVCGFTSLGTDACPACGAPFDPTTVTGSGPDTPAAAPRDPWSGREIRASDATIDVEVVEVDDQGA
jgi:hypothetical protein